MFLPGLASIIFIFCYEYLGPCVLIVVLFVYICTTRHSSFCLYIFVCMKVCVYKCLIACVRACVRA